MNKLVGNDTKLLWQVLSNLSRIKNEDFMTVWYNSRNYYEYC